MGNVNGDPHRSEIFPKQKAKPPGKTSELSQDRRQNHQERHQSCPFSDIDGVTASCLGITLMFFLVVLPPVLG